jgi:hypothetical protein
MSELTIEQIKDVLGWSYPTALKFAQRHGRQDGGGKWLVPYGIVADEVNEQLADAQRTVDRLAQVANGQPAP